MTGQEKLDSIEEAKLLIEKAMNIVDEVVSDMPIKGNYEAYGKYGFNQLLNNGNPYDDGLQEIIDAIDEDIFHSDE